MSPDRWPAPDRETSAPALVVDGLAKRFGDRIGFRDVVSFAAGYGDLSGFPGAERHREARYGIVTSIRHRSRYIDVVHREHAVVETDGFRQQTDTRPETRHAHNH